MSIEACFRNLKAKALKHEIYSNSSFGYIARLHRGGKPMILSDEQKAFFESEGYLLVEDAVSEAQLGALRNEFAGWVEASRSQLEAYGETIDGRARFGGVLQRQQPAPSAARLSPAATIPGPVEGVVDLLSGAPIRGRATCTDTPSSPC